MKNAYSPYFHYNTGSGEKKQINRLRRNSCYFLVTRNPADDRFDR